MRTRDNEQSTLDDDESTLPGLGPWVEVDQLQQRTRPGAGPLVDEEHAAVFDFLGAQIERYEWFTERVDPLRSLEDAVAVLEAAPLAPAAWERALVCLSLRDDDVAAIYLEEWQPPPDDPELCLFHQVCLTRGRRRQ